MPASACTPVPFQEGEELRYDRAAAGHMALGDTGAAEHGLPGGVPLPCCFGIGHRNGRGCCQVRRQHRRVCHAEGVLAGVSFPGQDSVPDGEPEDLVLGTEPAEQLFGVGIGSMFVGHHKQQEPALDVAGHVLQLVLDPARAGVQAGGRVDLAQEAFQMWFTGFGRDGACPVAVAETRPPTSPCRCAR